MKKIAVLAALKEEIEPLEKFASSATKELEDELSLIFSGSLASISSEVVWGTTGVGKAFASANTQRIIDHFKPDIIFLIGSCGGPTQGAAPGDIIVPTSTAQSDYDLTCSGYQAGAAKGVKGILPVFTGTETFFSELIRRNSSDLLKIDGKVPSIHRGVMTSRDSLITDLDQIKSIESQYNHVGWDMEAAAVNTVSSLNGIPCGIVKGILDRDGVYDKDLSNRIEHDVYENSFRLLYEVLKREV